MRNNKIHHIGTKYTLTMVVLVALFFSIIELFAYRNIETVVSDLYNEMAYHEVMYAESIFDTSMKKLQTVLRSPLYNKNFISAVSNHEKMSPVISDTLTQMLYDDPMIVRVVLYDTEGTLWYGGMIERETLPRLTFDEILATKWGKLAYEANGLEVFIPGNVFGARYGGNITTCCKMLRNPQTFEPFGMMVVSISERFLASPFIKNNIGVYAIVKDYPNGIDMNCLSESCLYSSEPLENFEGLGLNRLNIVSLRNQRTGWSILSISKKDDLTERANFFFVAQGIFILAMGGLMFIFFSVISRSISHPVRHLYRLVEDFGQGIYRTDEVFSNDEIGQIGNKFVEIMKENKILTINYMQAQLKEKEAEFQFLQAQINPHFIYNVLDSIYWMSQLEGASDVAKMSFSLSYLLRYSVNKNNESHTTVAKELELIKHYLQIQNIRYQNRFEVYIDIDESIMDCRIIKFLLEPFVENAIVHGLENKPGPGSLMIIGRDLDNELEFVVTDDGIGVEDEEAFYRGYGISNVIERVKLCYPTENAGVRFQSTPDMGTTVVIRIPKEITIA